MITLQDMSLAELYGLMLLDMVNNPQVANCVHSIVEQSDYIQVVPHMCVIRNDKYSVEFAITDSNILTIFYTIDLHEPGTLPMYDESGKETNQLQTAWDFKNLRKSYL